MRAVPTTVEELTAGLGEQAYLADRGLSTAIYLSLSLGKPLLLEGEAGVGKTEVAKVLSSLLDRELIRLQCYEGIDASQALYEWNYSRQLIAVRAMDAADAATHVEDLFGPEFLVERPLLAAWTGGELLRLQCYEGIDAGQAVYEWDYSRQLLHLRAVEASGAPVVEDELYSEQFLVRRPLLRAIAHDADVPPVLLVDEVDRADDEFEAFLLEILSDYAVTVPELGTFRAETPPVVVVTSNRTRDVHDALKRRCLYHWISHPDFERELAILRVRAPEVSEELARQVAHAVEALRAVDLYKPPGVAETIDWAHALAALGRTRIDDAAVDVTLGAVLKYREDQDRVRAEGLDRIVAVAGGAGG